MIIPTNNQRAVDVKDRDSIKAAGVTDIGKVRDHNEDAFSISEGLGLFIVSDGIGGAQAGQVAARTVVEALPVSVTSKLSASLRIGKNQMVAAMKQSIGELSDQVRRKGLEVPELRGMGATVVACLIRGGVASITHMGDSRAYLLRDLVLRRLTEDHTIVGLLLQSGQITKEEALRHPARHALTRYIGMEGDVGPEVRLLGLKEGDRLLMCSDGLTNEVSHREIGQILRSEVNLENVCEKLVSAANEAGGKDNITVLIVQYKGWRRQSRCKEKKVVAEGKDGGT